MSWFEIGLYIDRYSILRDEANYREELEWFRWRTIVADFRNAHRRKEDAAISGKDIVKLSFDHLPESKKKLTLKEVRANLGSTFTMEDRRN